jgi:hypothetical protein
MPILCALDWRDGVVIATLTTDPDGSVRLRLSHGVDECVVHLSRDSLDALALAGVIYPRPDGAPLWHRAWLR